MTRSLDALLRPKSIAVFGGRWAEAVVEQCQKFGFDGDIWPVHPDRCEISGRPCYQHIKDLPSAPDASFIGVNRYLTIDLVAELAARGAGGAVCFASGFDESQSRDAEGVSLQRRLVDAAGNMPVVGPNCYGFINYLDGALLWPDQHGSQRLGGNGRGVAILAQSSNIAINLTMQRRNLPIAYVVCLGNQAQIEVADIGQSLVDDDRVTAIGLHLEGVGDVERFEQFALKARERKIPLVAIKVGKSEAARAAVVTHTASMAGSDAASRAFLSQLGVAQVESLPAFVETLKLLHFIGPLSGRSISSTSCSGGEASLMADAAHDRRLHFRELSTNDKARIGETLSDLVVISNPLDYHTFIWGDEGAMTNTFSAMVGSGFDLSMMVMDFPRSDRCRDSAWDPAVNAIINTHRNTDAPMAVVSSLSENLEESQAQAFAAAGVAPLHGIEEAMIAAELAADVGEWFAAPLPVTWPDVPADSSDVINEAEAKSLLKTLNIPIPAATLVESGADPVIDAANLGFPLVAKAFNLVHKTEHGGVLLNLNSPLMLASAVADLQRMTSSVLIEEQITDGVCELLVGIHTDPIYGPLLTVGAGGVLVELLHDSVMMRLPVIDDQIRKAIATLKFSPLLNGYRGRAVADIDAVVDVILSLQDCFDPAVENWPRIHEIEINPLIVRPAGQGVVAVDALIRLEKH